MVRPADDVTIPHNRFGTGLGKPKFPTIISTSRLGDLINNDSWLIFSLLEMDTEFLNHDVQAWPGRQSFLEAKAKTIALNVVNDSAERGVKLSSDFLDAARSEEHYQNILQVVEADRKQIPSLRERRQETDRDSV